MEEKIKITCSECKKTGNYEITPKYCAYCGKIIYQLNSHNK